MRTSTAPTKDRFRRLSRLLAALWKDDSGVVITTELVILLTVLAIGMIVGLTTLRNAVVTELGDTAGAVGRTNQSFNYPGVTSPGATTAGSAFGDQTDFGEPNDGSIGNTGSGIVLNTPATDEGGQ